MKNVLIVDDEISFLLSLSAGLTRYADEYQVLTAENGKIAADHLAAQSIDLVVTDLKMPVMDGFELLALMKNRYSTTPVIIMTAFGTPELAGKIASLSAVQYLEKPLNLQQLAEKIQHGFKTGKSGFISGITLTSFMQVLGMEQKTCTLTITAGRKIGKLYFIEGEFIGAETTKKAGEEAAYEILCWEDARIEIQNVCNQNKKILIRLLTGF